LEKLENRKDPSSVLQLLNQNTPLLKFLIWNDTDPLSLSKDLPDIPGKILL